MFLVYCKMKKSFFLLVFDIFFNMSITDLLKDFEEKIETHPTKIGNCLSFLRNYKNPCYYRSCILYALKYVLIDEFSFNFISNEFLLIKNIEKHAKENESKSIICFLFLKKIKNPVHQI